MPDQSIGYGGYAHRVLVLLCGTSPAVVSETLQALSAPSERLHFLPTRIIVLTTTEGREALREKLLQPGPTCQGRRVGWLEFMANEWGQPPFPLAASDIRVPVLADGTEIPDAHSAEQLDAMGELMFEVLREATANPDTVVFFSLSGGRKSMSHMAGQCMSALARPQDKLLHVIVEPGWIEGVEDFLYRRPGQPRVSHPDPELQHVFVEQNAIQLTLAEEPLFRLRPMLERVAKDRQLLPHELTFTGWVSLTEAPPQKLRLEVDCDTGAIRLEGKPLRWAAGSNTRRAQAFLTVLVRHGQLRSPPTTAELLEVLDVWDRQSGGSFDDFTRGQKACELFDRHKGADPRPPRLPNFSLESLRAHFEISTDLNKVSLGADGRNNINSECTRLNESIKQSLPPSVDSTMFSIRAKRGCLALPENFDVIMTGAAS